jgi:hypothetical protein
MKFRVEVICLYENGVEDRGEVIEMDRRELAMETLGLNLAEAKAILGGVQDFVTARQVTEDLERRRKCPDCGQRHHSKSSGTSTVQTLFGPVPVPNPRWNRCSCQSDGPKTFRPTSVWLTERVSPELLYLETKWASLTPFAKVADLLKEVLPVGASTNHETVREHLQVTAERMEQELGEERQPNLFEYPENDSELRTQAVCPRVAAALLLARSARTSGLFSSASSTQSITAAAVLVLGFESEAYCYSTITFPVMFACRVQRKLNSPVWFGNVIVMLEPGLMRIGPHRSSATSANVCSTTSSL